RPAVVRTCSHRTVYLGSEHDVVAETERLERLTQDLLAAPGVVDVRGVPERHARLVGRAQDLQGIRLARRIAEVHAAEAEDAHFQAGPAERGVGYHSFTPDVPTSAAGNP